MTAEMRRETTGKIESSPTKAKDPRTLEKDVDAYDIESDLNSTFEYPFEYDDEPIYLFDDNLTNGTWSNLWGGNATDQWENHKIKPPTKTSSNIDGNPLLGGPVQVEEMGDGENPKENGEKVSSPQDN